MHNPTQELGSAQPESWLSVRVSSWLVKGPMFNFWQFQLKELDVDVTDIAGGDMKDLSLKPWQASLSSNPEFDRPMI